MTLTPAPVRGRGEAESDLDYLGTGEGRVPKGGDLVTRWMRCCAFLMLMSIGLGACTYYVQAPAAPEPPPPAVYAPPPQGLAPPHGYVGPTDPQRGSR